MNKESIKNDIILFLNRDCNQKVTQIKEDISLFSTQFKFNAMDMIYLFVYIENKYNIQFEESDIDNFAFYKINGLSEIIFSKISKETCHD